MTTLNEVKQFFSEAGTKEIANEAAGYQFVKRADGVMLQFSNGNFKFYPTIDGFAKAVLYRIKRG